MITKRQLKYWEERDALYRTVLSELTQKCWELMAENESLKQSGRTLGKAYSGMEELKNRLLSENRALSSELLAMHRRYDAVRDSDLNTASSKDNSEVNIGTI